MAWIFFPQKNNLIIMTMLPNTHSSRPNFSRIMYSDLQSIAPEQYMKQITKRITDIQAVSVSALKTPQTSISSYKGNFLLEPRGARCRGADPRVCLPLHPRLHRRRDRRHGRLPHRPGQDADAEPADELERGWQQVSSHGVGDESPNSRVSTQRDLLQPQAHGCVLRRGSR